MASRQTIESSKNPIVKRVRQVAEGAIDGLMLAEGVRLVEEALAAELEVVESLVSPRLYQNERGQELANQLGQVSEKSLDCTDQVLDRASGLKTQQGVIAVLKIPHWKAEDLFAAESPFLVIAAGVRDPGNLGALVRTAEAAGASGFVTLAGSADPYRDKALRGSSGSIFRMPVIRGIDVEDLLSLVDHHGVSLFAMDSQQGESYWDCDYSGAPQAFILGSEASGIPMRLLEQCKALLKIPLTDRVESLNVAVAAGLVLFEHRRRLLAQES